MTFAAPIPGAYSSTGRGLAGVIALVAWVGLVVQFEASFLRSGSAATAAWAMLRYFTVITNLLLAVVFTSVAFGRPVLGAPALVAGVTLSILLVGVIYGLLLRNLVELSGAAKVADLLMHKATPVLAPLFWLIYAPKGMLGRRDPLLWALFPLTYFIYALGRGAMEGFYAYHFMDPSLIGWARTGINAVVIAAGFILASYIMLWLDVGLARRAGA